MLARRDEAWDAAAVLTPDGLPDSPEPDPEPEPEPEPEPPTGHADDSNTRDEALRSLKALLLAVARENVQLRRGGGRESGGIDRDAVCLGQAADGSFQLLAGGQPWQLYGAAADETPPAFGDGLSAEERAKMASALAEMAAMNGEVDRARAAGKLIEPGGANDGRAADDGAAVCCGVPIAAAAASRAKGQLGADNFTRLGMLGKGAVGKVYLVREKGTNQLYAMKCMGKADITQRSKNKRIMLEREVMTMSRHPLVVSLHASFQSTDFLYHVMEYCPGGPLFGVLRRQPYCRFDEQTTRFYVAETVLALEYLHLQGYMYRDLKPENILISAQGHIRLSDFDLVRPMLTVAAKADGEAGETSLLSEDRASSFVGTAEYVAPEIIRRSPYTMTAEWWSVGILAYEMVSGYTPFVGRNTAATFRRILGAELKFRNDIPLTKECRAFISGCLQRAPTKRLGNAHGAAELQASRWMRGVEWSLLANTERPPYIPNMPLMPEEREGAGIADEQRTVAENAAVADRYRLYGRHFVQRGDGASGGGDGEGGEGGDEPDNPFAGFDWMAKDLIKRRQETDDDGSAADGAPPVSASDGGGDGGGLQPSPGSNAAAAAAAAVAESQPERSLASAEQQDAAIDGAAPAASATMPPRSKNPVGAGAAASLVSPMAAETGFDFGVPGCHNLPVKTSSDGSAAGSASEEQAAEGAESQPPPAAHAAGGTVAE